MSVGELGIDAARLEKSLADVLEMVTLWNAILLIDEADIFMEARTADSIQRNEIVSGETPFRHSYLF